MNDKALRRVIKVIVTATEFKTNIGKYLALVGNEDILITKNGKSVARLTNTGNGVKPAIHSLRGILKNSDVTRDTIRDERLTKYDETVD